MKERKNIDAQMASAEDLMAAAEKFTSNPQENEMLISSAENLITSAEAQITSAEIAISSSETQIEWLNSVIASAETSPASFTKVAKPKDRVSKGK